MNENALVRKWSPLATTIAREFFHPTLDQQDLRQEALIAVMVAGRTYDRTQGMSFHSFAAMCIRRRLASTLKTANRMKRDWRMEMPREVATDWAGLVPVTELIPAVNADPHELLASRDEVRRIVRGFQLLKPHEQRAITERLDGITQDKAMDNASYRARQKLRLAA